MQYDMMLDGRIRDSNFWISNNTTEMDFLFHMSDQCQKAIIVSIPKQKERTKQEEEIIEIGLGFLLFMKGDWRT